MVRQFALLYARIPVPTCYSAVLAPVPQPGAIGTSPAPPSSPAGTLLAAGQPGGWVRNERWRSSTKHNESTISRITKHCNYLPKAFNIQLLHRCSVDKSLIDT